MSRSDAPITISGNSGSIIQVGNNNVAYGDIRTISQQVKSNADWTKIVSLLQDVRKQLDSLPEGYAELRDTELIPITAQAIREASAQQSAPNKSNLQKFLDSFVKVVSIAKKIDGGLQVTTSIFDKVKEIATNLGLSIMLPS